MLTAVACAAVLIGGCDASIGDYRPASSMVDHSGFARDRRRALALNGQVIRIWGYVDHANVVPEPAAADVPETWDQVHTSHSRSDAIRFDLMSRPDGRAGSGIHVYLPKHRGGRKLLAGLAAHQAAGEPSRVLVTGKVFTFDAPTNMRLRTGLVVIVKTPDDVLLQPPIVK